MFGLVRDMLSASMRLRERRAGDRAYRWHLEFFDGSTWRHDGTTGLLLWNFFGKRTERYASPADLTRWTAGARRV